MRLSLGDPRQRTDVLGILPHQNLERLDITGVSFLYLSDSLLCLGELLKTLAKLAVVVEVTLDQHVETARQFV